MRLGKMSLEKLSTNLKHQSISRSIHVSKLIMLGYILVHFVPIIIAIVFFTNHVYRWVSLELSVVVCAGVWGYYSIVIYYKRWHRIDLFRKQFEFLKNGLWVEGDVVEINKQFFSLSRFLLMPIYYMGPIYIAKIKYEYEGKRYYTYSKSDNAILVGSKEPILIDNKSPDNVLFLRKILFVHAYSLIF